MYNQPNVWFKNYESWNEDTRPFSGTFNSLFDPKYCGITYCEPNYAVLNTNSIAYTLEYIYEGEGTIIHNNKEFHPKAGDIYIMHAFNTHKYYTNPQKPWKKIFLVLEGTLVGNILSNFGLSKTILIENFGNAFFLEKFYEYAKDSPNRHNKELFLLFTNFVIEMSEFIYQNQSSVPELIKEYIDNNIDKKITIEQICKITNYSRSSVYRTFKDKYGISIHEYLLKKKLQISMKYLKETNFPLWEIAERLSFNSASHFSTFIKTSTGMSPKDIRSQSNN